MSAPFNGTKTRVVGFFKGLFGKSADSVEPVRDDATYDYYQSAPLVTGAELTSPPPVAPPASNTFKTQGNSTNSVGAKPVASSQVNGRTGNGQAGNGSGTIPMPGQPVGHVNGRIVVAKTPATETKPAIPVNSPVAAPHKNGNGAHPAPVVPVSIPAAKPVVPLATGDVLSLSLANVVAGLPVELQPRLTKKSFDNHTIPVSLENILAQLSSGVVKITFGELRLIAPQFFTPAADADDVHIALPLGEILRQINPAQLAKPTDQVRIAADEDVSSPFADKGGNASLEVKSNAPTRSITPHAFPALQSRSGVGEVSNPAAPTANVTPALRIKLPATPAAGPTATRIPAPPTQPASPPPTSAPIPMPKAQVASPALPAAPKLNGMPSLRMAGGSPEAPTAPATATPKPAAPAAPIVPVAKPAATNSTATLAAPLKGLMEAWPEAIQQEITQNKLTDCSVELPLDSVAEQLKSGRVCFKWADIHDRLSPRRGKNSPNGEVDLDLPLKVVAPLFFAQKNGAPATVPNQRLKADEAIPDMFAQAIKPATPVSPVAATAPVAAAAPVAAPVELTPQAIVKRAAALKGVAGALIALPDGLVVASALPAGLNGDKVAAFLPQIFARFDACLKDLTMDRLDNLNFTAGKVPWHVFRSRSVFFAVFGRANEPLPTDWLATLAGELDRK